MNTDTRNSLLEIAAALVFLVGMALTWLGFVIAASSGWVIPGIIMFLFGLYVPTLSHRLLDKREVVTWTLPDIVERANWYRQQEYEYRQRQWEQRNQHRDL